MRFKNKIAATVDGAAGAVAHNKMSKALTGAEGAFV